MARKYLCNEEQTERVDPSTGEVILTTTKKTTLLKVSSDDEFFQVYYNHLNQFYELSGKEISLLLELNKLAIFNTGKVSLTADDRDQLTKTLNTSTSRISKMLSNLVKSKAIAGSRGSYSINPTIFWKGDKQKRQELLKSGEYALKVEYSLVDKNNNEIEI